VHEKKRDRREIELQSREKESVGKSSSKKMGAFLAKQGVMREEAS